MGNTDFKWMSCGGILLDGSGDIACTSEGSIASIRDIAISRLKAALDAWQLYPFGADLQVLVGSTATPEVESTIQRQVQQSLNNDFLPRGTFQVKTLRVAGNIQVVVFLNQQVLAQAMVSNITTANPTVTVIA